MEQNRFEGILIIGSMKDPHVEAVTTRLSSMSVPFLVVDFLGDTKVTIELDETSRPIIWIDDAPLSEDVLVWFRYKYGEKTTQSFDGEKRHIQVRLGEWLGFLSTLCRLKEGSVFNDIFSPMWGDSKIPQQIIAKQVGFLVPPSIVSNEHDRIVAFASRHTELIVKPNNSYSVDCRSTANDAGEPNAEAAQSTIMTMQVSEAKLRATPPQALALCPHFLQKEIKKDYELRVAAAGDECIAFKIPSQEKQYTQVDWRHGNSSLEFSEVELPTLVNERLSRYLSQAGLFSGSFDLIVDKEGHYWFLECNPEGQWMWMEEQCQGKISWMFARALKHKFQSFKERTRSTIGVYNN